MRSELIDTNAPLVDRGRAARVSVVARIGRVIDYLFGLLYALLLIRFALQFFGARTGAGFFQIIRDLTEVFYAPFKGLFPTTPIETGHFEWPLLVAVLGYMVLHAGIRGLLRLLARG
jgi:uncharacterized protein YggT (Ycf19 family)